MSWTRNDIPNLRGKICIVTGANTGLGFAQALALAAKHATVVLACRHAERAESALRRLRSEMPDADVCVSLLDLSSFASVRDFAKRFGEEFNHLDVLINNAGLMVTSRQTTTDGFEMQFGTNYLGPYLLTGLLLPHIEKAEAARVVSLSSLTYRFSRIHFDDINAERSFSPMDRYAQSKLACLMFALELQRRLDECGARTISLGAHPGVSTSELGRNTSGFNFMARFVNQSTEAGAEPALRAATDPSARGGEYYGPANWFGARGPAIIELPSRRARDAESAARLWALSETLSGIRYP